VPKKAVICYLSSLLFYGLGYAKVLVLNNGHLNHHDFTIQASLATAYFALTIFLAAIGSFFLYLRYAKNQELEKNDLEYKQIGD